MTQAKKKLPKCLAMNQILNNISGKNPEQILRECNQFDAVPINIKKILKDLQIKYIKDDFKNLSESDALKKLIEVRGDICGLVIATENDVGIFYKKNKNDDMNDKLRKSAEKRAKFTLAHELAHCCLHADHLDGGYVDFRCNQDIFLNEDIENMPTYEKNEYEANVFAGELLIPKHSLEKILEKLVVPSLNALVDIFQVSANVMRARLEYLGIDYVDDIIC